MAVVVVSRIEAVNQVGGAKHLGSTDWMRAVKQAETVDLDGQAWHPKLIKEVQGEVILGRMPGTRCLGRQKSLTRRGGELR